MGEDKTGEKVEKGWFAIKIRESKKLTFVRQTEEGGSSVGISGSNVLGRGAASVKTLRWEQIWRI